MIELIGYTAALFTASVMIPQIFRSIRTKSVRDISFMMLALYIINTGLWVTYGVLIGSGPILVADGFACCAGITQLIIKLKYNK